MSGSELPAFPYHPDPVASGSIERSDETCVVCRHARGWIYTGPVYALEELGGSICPWCVEDGSAAESHGAAFTDVVDVPGDVPAEVVETIARRTPGFTGWQQEHWLYHCGDGAAFLGLAGWRELQQHPDALDVLRREAAEDGWSPGELDGYLESLDKDGEPTAYLFRCRHCGAHLAYADFS